MLSWLQFILGERGARREATPTRRACNFLLCVCVCIKDGGVAVIDERWGRDGWMARCRKLTTSTVAPPVFIRSEMS